MIDWIKYAPIQLRDLAKEGPFRGPDFLRGKHINVAAAGSIIQFRCPRHSTKYKFFPPFHLKNKDCLDVDFSAESFMANNHWCYVEAFFRGWTYWSEWFQGHVGDFSLWVALCAREDNHNFDEISFLHPKGFEYGLTLYLNARYGVHRNPATVYMHKGPLKWKSINKLPVVAASFMIQPAHYIFTFPVSDKHFIFMRFATTGVRSDVLPTIEADIQKIINSVDVQLSPETQEKVDKIKAECPDYALPETFAPLNWPLKPEDVEPDVLTTDGQGQKQWLLGD